LAGASSSNWGERFFDAFFFSVQTLATIGYGVISPRGLAANAMVALEALLGLLGVALATGLSFSRFARPQARIRFAERAVVAPYREGWGFMFRLANERSSQLVEVQATVVLSHEIEGPGGKRERKFVPLTLERDRVVFLPLHWTVVHPITPDSPMAGLDARALIEGNAEIFILMTAFDEASSQTVHKRTSYKGEEIVFGARYKDIFVNAGGKPTIDISVLGAVTPV
jgi:inward rectifier potassium channel